MSGAESEWTFDDTLCSMCVMFVAVEEFNGNCSQSCLDQFMCYLDALDDEYLAAHVTAWTELQP